MQTKPRILVNRLGALGDVILTTPIVRKLYKDRDGFCEIAVRTMHPNVFKNNPYVHRLVQVNENLSLNDFDIILNLDYTYERNPSRHILDAYGFYAFGDMGFDRQCDLFSNENDVVIGKEVACQWPDGYIVFHMRNTVQESRNLPETFWSELISSILCNSNLAIVQIGAAHEYAFGNHPRLVDMRGKCSIHELKEVIDNARCFVGVDSAPFHVAATTSTDMVVFFTTAKAEYRKPYRDCGLFIPLIPDIDCYGCQERMPLGSTLVSCLRDEVDCINQFDPHIALQAILDLSKKS